MTDGAALLKKETRSPAPYGHYRSALAAPKPIVLVARLSGPAWRLPRTETQAKSLGNGSANRAFEVLLLQQEEGG
jgi:hypothetical protein